MGRGSTSAATSHPLEELGKRDAKRAGDSNKRSDRGIRAAPFDHLKVLGIEGGAARRFFLRETLFVPQGAHSLVESQQTCLHAWRAAGG